MTGRAPFLSIEPFYHLTGGFRHGSLGTVSKRGPTPHLAIRSLTTRIVVLANLTMIGPIAASNYVVFTFALVA